ncbi:MAG: cupin domain-containing protein [Clostridiaceae bacterium]|jgi:quercetin dioxygenase-like cupin family protein|nr:cupin domain-containing protein [Clostridiaceae bacterium]
MFISNRSIGPKQLDEKTSRKILGTGGSLMMVEVTFKKGGVGEVHSHDAHEQVSYIVKGSFEVTLGAEKKLLTEGDSFYAGINVPHGVVALEDSIILDVFTPLREDFLG